MADQSPRARDPRVHPAPGDVLQKSRTCIDCTRREVRVVTSVVPNGTAGREHLGLVHYRNRPHNRRTYASIRLLDEWRKWAAGAEVVEVGEREELAR